MWVYVFIYSPLWTLFHKYNKPFPLKYLIGGKLWEGEKSIVYVVDNRERLDLSRLFTSNTCGYTYSFGIFYLETLYWQNTNNKSIYVYKTHFGAFMLKLIKTPYSVFVQNEYTLEHTVLRYLCKLIEICHFRNINICAISAAVS